MKRLGAILLGIILAGPAGALDLQNMTPDERTAFETAVHDYLMQHPEVIFEAVDAYQNRQAAAQARGDADLIQSNAQEIFNDGTSWVGGNPDGDITVVEFMDYKCGYCKKAYGDVKSLVDGDGNIRFVVKEFPILGDESMMAARFAIAVQNVAGDKAYGAVHDELMNLRSTVNMAALGRIAKQQGLDMAAIKTAMISESVDREIQANYSLAQKLGISGTPGFVFQTEMLRGYAPLDAMKQIVDRVRGS